MRVSDLLRESISIVFENTTADELIPYLNQLGFDSIDKMTGKTIRVVVPDNLRPTAADQILNTLPGATKSADGKIVYYDGATIKIKPASKQGDASLSKETGQRNIIDTAIKNELKGQPEILLQVGNRRVRAAGAHPAHPGVKADIAIVDAKGHETAWVSLKDGTTPRGFQGWGGITHQPVVSHPEVEEFANHIILTFGKEGLTGGSYGRAIQDPVLKNQVVFGKHFGEDPGQSNVDLVLQGHPRVDKIGKVLTLTGDHHWANGETPSDGYEPILMADYRTDRANFGVPNTRMSVYPKGGRSYTDI